MSEAHRPQQVLLAAFTGTRLPGWLRDRLAAGLAGVCLFGSNVESPRQLARLTDAIRSANPRALVAVDEEGGDVTRLYAGRGSPYPGNAWLGRWDDPAETERNGRLVGEQLAAVGCNLNLAPCVDVSSNPLNPVIGVRSFGADPRLVARHGVAWINGQQAAGVAACAKHFPGHGGTTQDSHLALPTVDRTLEQLLGRELVPFDAAVAAGVWAVMTSHILLPELDHASPATFSCPVLESVLRARTGFSGVVVSDALDMAGASADIGIPEAAVCALIGGCDLLCIGSATPEALLARIEASVATALEQGRLASSRLETAVERVETLAGRVAGPPGRRSTETLGPVFADPTGLMDAAGLRRCFELTEAASRQLAAAPAGADVTLVKLNTAPSVAAGPTPWGPFAALDDQCPPVRHVRVFEAWPSTTAAQLPAAGLIVMVGRANHRHRWVRSLADETRQEGRRVVVVDMGWPDESRTYADVATFGSSRALGNALLELVARKRLSPASRAG